MTFDLLMIGFQDCLSENLRSEASRMLNQILPVVIRFLADEYDDTSSTVFPLLHAVLASVSPSQRPTLPSSYMMATSTSASVN